MLRSMYTSISGLKNHQTLLDVTANNIANVNTYGFKGSRVAFKDLLSQTMQGASGPTATLGGTNARQVGLGMQIDSIQQIHTQGNLQNTGNVLDVAITGDGYFEVTTNGALLLDGNAATNPPIEYQRAGNFSLDVNGDLVTSDGAYVVGWAEAAPAGSGVPDVPTAGPPPTTGTKINLRVPPATTKAVTIGQDGRVTRIDSVTGNPTTVGWIAMAKFANPSGLSAAGSDKWTASNNSGTPVEGTGGDANGIGTLTSGALEMSNVDLATEFTEMIRAQRGFQANSRVITTSDEILQELVNLKR